MRGCESTTWALPCLLSQGVSEAHLSCGAGLQRMHLTGHLHSDGADIITTSLGWPIWQGFGLSAPVTVYKRPGATFSSEQLEQLQECTSQPRGPHDAANIATKRQMKTIMMSPAVVGILVPVNVTAVRMPVAICMVDMTVPHTMNRTFLPPLQPGMPL